MNCNTALPSRIVAKVLRSATDNVIPRIRSIALPVVQSLVLTAWLAGCSSAPSAPDRPMYKIQVGWTKDEVSQDSRYRQERKKVSTTTTASGTVEIWAYEDFRGSPLALVFFDKNGKVTAYSCLSACQ